MFPGSWYQRHWPSRKDTQHLSQNPPASPPSCYGNIGLNHIFNIVSCLMFICLSVWLSCFLVCLAFFCTSSCLPKRPILYLLHLCVLLLNDIVCFTPQLMYLSLFFYGSMEIKSNLNWIELNILQSDNFNFEKVILSATLLPQNSLSQILLLLLKNVGHQLVSKIIRRGLL